MAEIFLSKLGEQVADFALWIWAGVGWAEEESSVKGEGGHG